MTIKNFNFSLAAGFDQTNPWMPAQNPRDWQAMGWAAICMGAHTLTEAREAIARAVDAGMKVPVLIHQAIAHDNELVVEAALKENLISHDEALGWWADTVSVQWAGRCEQLLRRRLGIDGNTRIPKANQPHGPVTEPGADTDLPALALAFASGKRQAIECLLQTQAPTPLTATLAMACATYALKNNPSQSEMEGFVDDFRSLRQHGADPLARVFLHTGHRATAARLSTLPPAPSKGPYATCTIQMALSSVLSSTLDDRVRQSWWEKMTAGLNLTATPANDRGYRLWEIWVIDSAEQALGFDLCQQSAPMPPEVAAVLLDRMIASRPTAKLPEEFRFTEEVFTQCLQHSTLMNDKTIKWEHYSIKPDQWDTLKDFGNRSVAHQDRWQTWTERWQNVIEQEQALNESKDKLVEAGRMSSKAHDTLIHQRDSARAAMAISSQNLLCADLKAAPRRPTARM